jgi:dTDP-4-dehydrorhamnose reductase
MKIVVTGAKGQIGQDVVKLLSNSHEVYGLGRAELDITNERRCAEVMDAIRPDAIIHCAAYTSVDEAESEEDQAFLVNATGTKHVAMAAERIGAKLCYLSTDYVFDGLATTPYREYDHTFPQTVYGKSKWMGEQYVKNQCSKHFIVRTSWVYGLEGANFVKLMLKLGRENGVVRVVNDQIGSPTYAYDLALFLQELIQSEHYGTYHASNSGTCSWYDFAKAIFAESGIEAQVTACSTEELSAPAPRPKYSVMDHIAIRLHDFTEFRHWQEALRSFLGDYLVSSDR